jgi:hypothetical protein
VVTSTANEVPGGKIRKEIKINMRRLDRYLKSWRKPRIEKSYVPGEYCRNVGEEGDGKGVEEVEEVEGIEGVEGYVRVLQCKTRR